MAIQDYKKTIGDLTSRLGKAEVRRILVNAGISTSAADKLAAGRYPSEIGVLMGAAIQRALEALKQKAS